MLRSATHLIGGSRRHARMYSGLGRLMGLRPILRPIPVSLIPESYRIITRGDDAAVLLFPLMQSD
jgi:hypothetical protein